MSKRNRRENIYLGIQLVLLIVLFIYVGFIFSMKSDSRKSFQEVAAPIQKQAEKIGLLPADEQTIKRLYKINVTEFDGVMLYKAEGALDVDEVLLVKAKTEAQAEMISERAQERIDTQIKTFEGYGAAQTKLLKRATVESRGTFVFLAVSPEVEKLSALFKKSL